MCQNKSRYMDGDECGSSGVWNIFSYFPLDNVFL